MTYWRALAAIGLLEAVLLTVLWPPPFGWRAEFRSWRGVSRVNLLDPAIRYQVTSGKQSVDDEGHVIECATSTHRNCHPR